MNVRHALLTFMCLNIVMGKKIPDIKKSVFDRYDKAQSHMGQLGIKWDRAEEATNWFCDYMRDKKAKLTKNAEVSGTFHGFDTVVDMRIQSASEGMWDFTKLAHVDNCKSKMEDLRVTFCQFWSGKDILGCNSKITYGGWATHKDITYTALRRTDSMACPLPPSWSEDLHCFAIDDVNHNAIQHDAIENAIGNMCKQLSGKRLKGGEVETLSASENVYLEVKGVPENEEPDRGRCGQGTQFEGDEKLCRTGFDALAACPQLNGQGKGGVMRWNCLYWTIKSAT